MCVLIAVYCMYLHEHMLTNTYMTQNQDAYCMYVTYVYTQLQITYLASHGNIFKDHKPFKNYIHSSQTQRSKYIEIYIRMYVCMYCQTPYIRMYI